MAKGYFYLSALLLNFLIALILALRGKRWAFISTKLAVARVKRLCCY